MWGHTKYGETSGNVVASVCCTDYTGFKRETLLSRRNEWKVLSVELTAALCWWLQRIISSATVRSRWVASTSRRQHGRHGTTQSLAASRCVCGMSASRVTSSEVSKTLIWDRVRCFCLGSWRNLATSVMHSCLLLMLSWDDVDCVYIEAVV